MMSIKLSDWAIQVILAYVNISAHNTIFQPVPIYYLNMLYNSWLSKENTFSLQKFFS